MSRFLLLARHIQEGLQGIEPTYDGDLMYFPCSVTLTSGDALDTVLFHAGEAGHENVGSLSAN
jgi:hypothetical protein